MKPLSDCHVLVTPTSYGRHDPRLCSDLEELVGKVTYNTTGRPLSSAQLQELLPGVDGYIAGLDVIDAAALQAADRLQVIARYGVGVDNVDLAAAEAKGVTVTNTPGANAVAVAELTMTLLLLLARPVLDAVAETRAGGWPRTSGLALEGKTVGLIGLGAIGKEVARRLAGFDCCILAYDPAADEAFAADNNVAIVDLERLLQQADFVSLHAPLLPQTRRMVNADFLDRMKEGSFLINTARGELVDEDALYEALVSEHLSGAALDAFDREPPGPDNRLLQLPQVVPTPHMGAHTDGATNNMGRMALQDCLRVLRGEKPKYRVV
ncbi:MAG: phosphoglycerate dehydrogenase [bacterium]